MFRMNIILASASPRRKELLAMITPDFEVICSDVDESSITADSPKQLAQALAKAKCMAVAQQYPEKVVIGCDTVVEKDGRVYGKPKNEQDAVQMLQTLSGASHEVHTGVCIAKGTKVVCFAASSTVRFYPLSDEQIAEYVKSGEPFDKAGGYGIQGGAALFCEGIEGCYYNIMGFPVSRVARALQEIL